MQATRGVAVTAALTSLIVGSNLALANFPNVKLDGVVVFVITLAFGYRIGSSVAILSELIWSQVSPWGASGTYLLTFLITAELLYVVAGWTASKVWRNQGDRNGGAILFGGLLAVSTFLWDIWTNLGTALLFYWPNITSVGILIVEFNPGALAFNLLHESSNLLLGLFLAPVVVKLILKGIGARQQIPMSSGR